MCIRDSYIKEVYYRFFICQALLIAFNYYPLSTGFKLTIGAIHRDRRPGCLLYTSDAADERSSVDLGGRRIIKKKKIENTDVCHIRIQANETENIKQAINNK